MRRYDAYRDSGVEWASQIPSHWEVVKVKYGYRFMTGATPPTKVTEYFEGDNKWANISDIKGKEIFDTGKRLSDKGVEVARMVKSPKGSLFYSFKLSVGAVAFCGEDMYTNEAIATFLPGKNSLRYLYYLAPVAIIQNANVNIYGAYILNQELINNAFLVLPPLAEQQAIADYLDAETARIDSIIEARERKIKLLEELRNAIISKAVTKGIDENVETKDSGIEWIGSIPKHWEVSVFKRFLNAPMKYGANESAEFDNPSWPRYIRITDIDDQGNLKPETFKSLPPNAAEEYLLKKGDILFARSGATVGKTYLHKGDITACYAGYLIKAECGSKILPEYIFYYTQTNAYDNWKNSVFIQATIQNIGADKYSCMPIVIPPIEEQAKIISYVKEKHSQIEAKLRTARKEIDLLKEYRSALITEVVTGKRKVI